MKTIILFIIQNQQAVSTINLTELKHKIATFRDRGVSGTAWLWSLAGIEWQCTVLAVECGELAEKEMCNESYI